MRLFNQSMNHVSGTQSSSVLVLIMLIIIVCSTSTNARVSEIDILNKLTPQERSKVISLIQVHETDMTIVPFAQMPYSEQAINLGSWLVAKGYFVLGSKVLQHALKYQTEYTIKQLGLIYNLLASSTETDFMQAKDWYNKAIAHGSLNACVNLGVLYEKQKAYPLAAQTYQKCTNAVEQVDITDKETVALAYLNLGTLHYNGVLSNNKKKDQQLGGKLWMLSHQLNPYDLDIHYNLSVYHRYVTQNFYKARYHLSVCAWHEVQCASALSSPDIVTLSSENTHLQVLLNGTKVDREHILSYRATYWLPEPTYFGIPESYGEINTIVSSDALTGIEISFSSDTAEQAISTLNRLVFVDMFSHANAKTYLWSKPLKPQTTSHLGQKLQLSKQSNRWLYKIIFQEVSHE